MSKQVSVDERSTLTKPLTTKEATQRRDSISVFQTQGHQQLFFGLHISIMSFSQVQFQLKIVPIDLSRQNLNAFNF